MKFAPNIFFIVLLCLFIFGSCIDEKKPSSSPSTDEEREGPAVKSADSVQWEIPTHPPVPDTNSPSRAKKNSKSDLDTLRPIKA